jgi:hypothetical protein
MRRRSFTDIKVTIKASEGHLPVEILTDPKISLFSYTV